MKKVKVVAKKVRKITKKRSMKKKPGTGITPHSGGSVHHASAPSNRGNGTIGSSKKSSMNWKKQEEDITAE